MEHTKKGPAAVGRKTSPSGGFIPERIRINSRYILEILEALSDADHLKAYRGAHAMLRPFRFLGYYEKAIREKLLQLKERFPEPPEALQEDGSQYLKTNDQGPDVDPKNTLTVPKAPTPGSTVSSEKEPSDVNDDSSDSGDDISESPNPYTDSHEASRHLQCVVDFIDANIQERTNFLASDKCTAVTLADIWYLLRPGDEVVEQNLRQAYKVIQVSDAVHDKYASLDPPERSRADTETIAYSVYCVYIDFDGNQLGPVVKTFEIAAFEGEKAITSLEVYPLRFTNKRDNFIAKAKTFLDVASIKHMHYNGLTLDNRDEVDSQVVIDFEEAFTQGGYSGGKPEIEALTEASFPDSSPYFGCTCEPCLTRQNGHGMPDSHLEKKRSIDYIANLVPSNKSFPPAHTWPRQLRDIKESNNILPDDDLVVVSHRVFGFILRNRSWGKWSSSFLG